MPHRKIKRAQWELALLLLLVTITTLVFWLTDLDLRVAAWFYHPELPKTPWPIRQAWLVKPIYDYAFSATIITCVVAFSIYLFGRFHALTKRFRRRSLYILLVIALGPGLVVNLIFKDHWGRARPVHVKEFGGAYDYVPPGKIAHTPDKSFVCGHCSVGYVFFALYFLSQTHKWLYLVLTLSLAWTIGFTRMTAGGHFLSDVLWSGYLVFFVAYALYYGWFLDLRLFRVRQVK